MAKQTVYGQVHLRDCDINLTSMLAAGFLGVYGIKSVPIDCVCVDVTFKGLDVHVWKLGRSPCSAHFFGLQNDLKNATLQKCGK